MRPLGAGDAVTVLRAARLPIEESLGVGVIQRIARQSSGQSLYWVSGFPCARTERTLRRWKSLAEAWAEQDEMEHG